jgi:FkbM family methyltransferase
LSSNEVFLDCGAYDGDTIKDLLERSISPTIYGYEPDPKNYRKLKNFVNTLPKKQREKIFIYQNAVDSKTKKLRFSASGAAGASLSETGDTIVNAITLDNQYFNPLPTFIKLDIEGAEKRRFARSPKTNRILQTNNSSMCLSPPR